MTIAYDLRAKCDKLSDEVHARRLTLIINAGWWGVMLIWILAGAGGSGAVAWTLLGSPSILVHGSRTDALLTAPIRHGRAPRSLRSTKIRSSDFDASRWRRQRDQSRK